MQGSVIMQSAGLCCAVLDKNVTVREGRQLRGVEDYPIHVKKGVTV